MSTTAMTEVKRPSVWPLLAAPLVAVAYYLVLISAFKGSVESAVGVFTAPLRDVVATQWGSHWIYRIFAEAVSVGLATFVSAGLARGRERVAGVTGGATIALVFLAGTTVLLYVRMHPDAYVLQEPWYQYAVSGCLIIGSPIIGSYTSEAARDINGGEPVGFAGINRLHFLWLWFPAYWYAFGLITPVVRFFELQFSAGESPSVIGGLIVTVELLIIGVIPAAVLLIPGYLGLALLSHHAGTKLHPVTRNLLGVVVLIVGFVIGGAIQLGWQDLIRWLFS